MTDEASLRHEFRVSTGRNLRKSIKNPPLRHFACILRHNIAFLPVETWNSCLSEAASVTTLKVMPDEASLRHEFRVSTGRKQIKGDARLCLTEARVPSFNGEKADLKPAITSFYMYFYVIPFFSPFKVGTRASLRHVVWHHLKNTSLRHFTCIFTSYLSSPR